MIPLAALITAVWIIGSAIVAKPFPGFRLPFLLAYGLGVILMEPWKIGSLMNVGMVAIMLIILAMWVAAGCLVGSLPASLVVFIASKVRHRFK